MTTRVTIKHEDGPKVYRVFVSTVADDGTRGAPIEVPLNESREFYVWDTQKLEIFEIADYSGEEA